MSRSDLSKYKATVRMIWFLNLRQNKTKQTYPSVWWAMWSISRSLIECDIIFKWEFRILIRDGRSGSVTPTDRSKLCACIKRKWWWSEDVNGFFFRKSLPKNPCWGYQWKIPGGGVCQDFVWKTWISRAFMKKSTVNRLRKNLYSQDEGGGVQFFFGKSLGKIVRRAKVWRLQEP